MDITTRMLDRETDWQAAAELGCTTWADDRRRPLEDVRVRYPWRAMLGAFVDDELVGQWGSFAMEVAVPGPLGTVRLVPTEGATAAAVHPDFRRRGVVTALIRRHLERCREVGVPLTIHGASEPGIYGRFGYAWYRTADDATLGSNPSLVLSDDVEAQASRVRTRSELSGPHLAERFAAVMRTCTNHLGAILGEPWHTARDLTDTPQTRLDVHPAEVMWATRDGVDVGVALISRKGDWNDQDLPSGKVTVQFMDATDPGALAALVRRICSYDLMSSVTIRRWGLESPLAAMLPDGPRTFGTPRPTDDVWLRIVDLPAALEARGYASACDVVLEVTDALLPDNAGRWRLNVGGDGVGRCTPTTDAADISLDVTHLAAAYLGQRSLRTLATNGTIVEHTTGKLGALSRACISDQVAYGGFGF